MIIPVCYSREDLIAAGLLRPPGYGIPMLRLTDGDRLIAAVHIQQYFASGLEEMEQEQSPYWKRFFQEDEEYEEEQ